MEVNVRKARDEKKQSRSEAEVLKSTAQNMTTRFGGITLRIDYRIFRTTECFSIYAAPTKF